MFLNLKQLNESLEKKYTLNETFDESMPKWLRDAIGISNLWGGQSKTYKRSYFSKYPHQPNSHYSTRHNYNTPEELATLGLGPALLNRGIDISKVKIIEAPIPDKVPRITKHNQIIPIFHLQNGQVWAKGINDKEKYNPTGRWAKDMIPFGLMNGKDIIADTVDYAYIDLSDPNINTVTDKRDKRRQLMAELDALPNYYRGPAGIRGHSTASGYEPYPNSYDLSGYSSKKLVDRREERKIELKAKKVPELYKKLLDRYMILKQDVTTILLSDDNSNVGTYAEQSMMSDIEDVITNLRSASDWINYASETFDTIEETKANMELTPEKKQLRIQVYSENMLGYIEDANEELEDGESRVEIYKKAVVDW